jgi:arylsulfatase A-like enzyme
MSLPRLGLALLSTVIVLSAAERPNVLFIFADDQRADTIAALGNPVIKTPNLDRLVARGVSFERAYMQGGNNGATCVPSRAMLLSARPLPRIDEKLSRDETWPHAFGAAGYATFMAGKWHNTPGSVGKSFQQARSLFVGGMTNPLKAKINDLLPSGKLSPERACPKHLCEEATDEVLRFLRERDPATPFFAYLAFDGPHDPHVVPEDFPVKYDPTTIPLPANFLPRHPFNNGEMVIRDEQLLPWPRTPAAIQGMLADYYRYISYLDLQVGRVLAALDASPAGRNTYVVFAADSGVARGSHGLIGKQNLYEHSLRVPLVFTGPGVPAGRRAAALCYTFDVMPTLGKLCGVPAPATSEGQELTAVLADPSRAARTELVFGYKRVQKAITDGRWKLIRYPQVARTQLFDLQADPAETKDLAAEPEQAARVKELLARLESGLRACGDADPLTAKTTGPAEWTPPKKLPQPGERGF